MLSGLRRSQVTAVYYPGLPSAPRYQLVQELFRGGGAGGMLSFEVRGGVPAADLVLKVSRVITIDGGHLWTTSVCQCMVCCRQ